MITTDNELLGRYLYKDDITALEELVSRHSGLVMGVCRSMLFHSQDAEDAFQTTFLILSRKAKDLVNHGSVSGWLYQVAVRNCLQIRRRKRRKRETIMVSEPAVGNNEPWQAITNAEQSELIYREINRLPKRYREVIVLCHLQGHTRIDAAELLGWTDAAVKAALSRGRNLLRKRLVRRGLMTGALLLTLRTTTISAAESITPSLLTTTLEHCQGLIPESTPNLPGTTPEFVQTLASQGAFTMQATTTKTIVISAALLLAISLPLAVIASQIPNDTNVTTLAVSNVSPNEKGSENDSQTVEFLSTKNNNGSHVAKIANSNAQDKETTGVAEQKMVNVYRLSFVNANAAKALVEQLLGMTSPEFKTIKLAVDETTNSLIVSSPPQKMEQVESLIKFLDKSAEEPAPATSTTKAGSESAASVPNQKSKTNDQDFSIANSEKYWQMILKSREAMVRSLQTATKLPNADREKIVSELYQALAEVVEAELNLNRIKFEGSRKKQGYESSTTKGVSASSPTTIPLGSKSIVKLGEVLLIESMTDSSLNRRVVVQADFTISHPFARELGVKNATPEQISEKLNVLFAKFVKDPAVFVARESASMPMPTK